MWLSFGQWCIISRVLCSISGKCFQGERLGLSSSHVWLKYKLMTRAGAATLGHKVEVDWGGGSVWVPGTGEKHASQTLLNAEFHLLWREINFLLSHTIMLEINLVTSYGSDDKKNLFPLDLKWGEEEPETAGCHHMKQGYQKLKSTHMKETWTDIKTSLMTSFELLDPAISEATYPPASTTLLFTSRIIERYSLVLDNMLILYPLLSYASQYMPPPTSFGFCLSQFE